MRTKAFCMFISAGLSVVGIVENVQSQTTWNNAGTGSWTTSTNWTPSTTPTAATNVTINNGGTAQVTAAGALARSVVLGNALGQSGNLEITGPGTLAVGTSFPAFFVGNFGSGTVTISSGGTLTTTLLSTIGNQTGSYGKVTITGAGSVWNDLNGLEVGSSGEGELHILSGGKFGTTSAVGINVGNDDGAKGTIYVTGSGSNLRASSVSIGAFAGGTGEVQVSGSGAGFTATSTVTVAAGGTSGTGAGTSGKLLFDNSATGSFQGLSVGNVAGGTGEVKLQNNAALTVTNTASIGVGGTGTLLISTGADLTSGGGFIAVNSTSGGTQGSGTVSVSGLGSSWLMGSSALRMGESSGNNGVWAGGGATLSVLNGAQVGAGSLTGIHSSTTYGTSSIAIGGLGSDAATRAKLTITNALSLSARTGKFNLNVNANGHLTSGAATLSALASGTEVNALVTGPNSTWGITGELRVNAVAGAKSSLLVTGTGASLTNTARFYVDGAGTAEFTITEGASATLGVASGFSHVGELAKGKFTVDKGSTVTATWLSLGSEVTGDGTAILKDANTKLTLDTLTVGSRGKGTLTISAGAQMESHGSSNIGFYRGSVGSVTVTGAGTKWTAVVPPPLSGLSDLSVGVSGLGTMRVEEGAYVSSQGLHVGGNLVQVIEIVSGVPTFVPTLPGEGHMVVTGAGTIVDLNISTFQMLTVGEDGSLGTLDILDGARINVLGSAYIADSANYAGTTYHGNGTVTVDGAGSQLIVRDLSSANGTIDVGARGVGVLNVTNGGFVSTESAYVGSYVTSSDGVKGDGTVNVNGANSKWEVLGTLRVGDQGIGKMNVTAGGTVTSNAAIIAASTNATGDVLVSGLNSQWGITGNIMIGQNGTATLTVADTAIVSATGTASINTKSTLNIGNGAAPGIFGATSITNNGKVIFNHTGTLSFSPPIGGTGSVEKKGTGKTTLTGTHGYSGATTVTEGTFVVNGSLSATSGVSVAAGATLGGTGSILSTVTVAGGGHLAAGTSPGTLTLNGLVLNDTTALDYELGLPQPPGVAGTNSDLIQVNGALTLDGVLNIDPLTGFNIGTYRLINYTTLTTNGGLGLGDVPLGLNYTVDVATPGQVNLIISLTDLQYWDGPNTVGNNVVNGGTSTWNNSTANWTTEVGFPNSGWNQKTAIFSGTAGTVTLGDNISFEGLQFITSGYVIDPDLGGLYTLTPGTDAPVLVNPNATATINAVLAGSGGLSKGGTGTLNLTAINTYKGPTAVNAGALYVNGSLETSDVTVASDATLGGTGRIVQDVSIGALGTIKPGDGVNPGALRVGTLSLDNTSFLDFALGAPGAPTNSHIEVDGDLLLDGRLRVTDAGGFTADTYNLMSYGGSLTDAGLTILSLPAGFNPGDFSIDTDTAGEVNLVVVEHGAGLQYWDGTNDSANGFVDGGSGVWNVADTDWTNREGNINGPWAGETGVFTTRPGIVTLGSDVPFQKLIFEVSGYRIVSPNGQKLYSLGDAEVNVVRGARATIAAPISVPGVFSKTGAGRLVLAGATPSYAGVTLIQQGGLYVNTVLRSPFVHVGEGGTLGGGGLIVGNVLNDGIVAPGNSVGTLAIHGNFRQTSSGTLELEIAGPHRFDQLIVSGTAHLGGTLDVRLLGADLEYGDQFPFLHAGRIKGRFSRITMPNPAINRGRFYTVGGTGILLVAPTSYTLVAETPNQTRLARALDRWIGIEDGDIGVTTLALDMLREEQYPAAFEAILPGHYDAALQISTELAHNQMQGLHQQFSSRRLAQRAMGAKAYRQAAPQTPSTKNPKSVKVVQDGISPPDENLWNVWTQASGLFSQTGWGTTPDNDFESGTFLAGADYALSDQFAVGIFAGYQMGEGDYAGRNEADLEKVTFGAYALYDRGNFYAHATVEGGAVEYEVRRAIVLPTLDRAASSEPDGQEVSASFGTGYDFQAGDFTFGPSVAIQYTRQSLDGFTERGADSLDLRMDDSHVESLRSYLGARAAYNIKLPGEVFVIPELRAFWQHEFLQDGDTLHARLAGGSGPGFDYLTDEPERDAFFIGGGVNIQVETTFFGGLFYHAEIGRTDEVNHTISVNASWKF